MVAAYAGLYGLELVAVVEDAGCRPRRSSGPACNSVLAMLRKGDVQAVVVAKLDRLTRSVRDLGQLLDEHFGPKGGAALLSCQRADRRPLRRRPDGAQSAGDRDPMGARGDRRAHQGRAAAPEAPGPAHRRRALRLAAGRRYRQAARAGPGRAGGGRAGARAQGGRQHVAGHLRRAPRRGHLAHRPEVRAGQVMRMCGGA